MLRVVAMAIHRVAVEAGDGPRGSGCRPLALLFVEAQAGLLEWEAEIVEQLAGLTGLVGNQGLVLENVLAQVQLAAIVLEQIEHGRQVMSQVFEAVAAVEALGYVVCEHGHADIERMAHHVDDLGLREGHLQQGQMQLVEGCPVCEEGFAASVQQTKTLCTREVVVAKQGRRVLPVSGPALREVLRIRLRRGQHVTRDLPKLTEEREISACGHGRVTAQDPVHHGRSGARRTHYENRLRNVRPLLCTRHPRHVLAREELFEAVEQGFDRIGLILQTTGLGGQLAFAADEILPCLFVMSEAFVQPASRKPLPSVELLGRIECCDRFLGTAAISCRIVQRRGGGCLCVVGRDLARAVEALPGLVQAPLQGEVVAEIYQKGRLRLAILEGPPQMPFPRQQIAAIGEKRAEQVVSLSVSGIHSQSGARHLFGVGRLAVGQEKLDELVVSPIGARVDPDHGIERSRGFADLTPMPLDLVADLERVDVAAGRFQPLLDRLFGGFDFTARESFAGAQHQGMDGFSHERTPRNRTDAVIKTRYGACFARACLALLLFFACAAAPVMAQTLDVIPAPATVAPGPAGDSFAFRADTWISLPRDPGVARIARYFAGLLEETSGVRVPIADEVITPMTHSVILFRLDPAIPHASPEAYEINITGQEIVVAAADTRGLFYGAVTLWQLCSTKPAIESSEIRIGAARITDGPRLPWRGLMLDSARHFQSPQFIMRLIDWMALHKLNVFHWHLTDDQGWRLEIKKYPRLTEVGAWRIPAGAAAAGGPYGGFYTQDDVRRIVAHAAERNITVVPEIDMPGHATAAIVAYPRLGVTDHPPAAVPSDWGIYSNLYNVEDSTFKFLEDVLDEVMTLFPGEYIHVGGDEAVKDQWKASPRVQARMRELLAQGASDRPAGRGITSGDGHPADEQALQSYFIQRIEQHLAAHGRRLIGWDEILEGGIAPEATIMSWRGLDGAVAAASEGHDTVLSPWPILYFDNRQGSGAGEPPGRGRVLSLQEVYGFDPMPAGIAPDQRHHVLGLQANVWTEHIRTEDRVAYMTFPRAAAVAEIGWSPSQARNWEDFLRRLPSEFARYHEMGLRYSDDALKPAPAPLGQFDRHASQDLQTCTDKVVLSLEDDAPVQGHRAVFLIDIENPCWLFRSADLSRGLSLTAAVGQVPFNFQIGKDRDAIRLAPPQTAAGELEVYLDSCPNDGPGGQASGAIGPPGGAVGASGEATRPQGRRIAVLPLAPAVDNDAVTELPAVHLPPTAGRHDLCFRFTQRMLDPLWALDWVQLQE